MLKKKCYMQVKALLVVSAAKTFLSHNKISLHETREGSFCVNLVIYLRAEPDKEGFDLLYEMGVPIKIISDSTKQTQYNNTLNYC